jgi:hypothetical protein
MKMVSQKSKGHIVATSNKPLTHESLGGRVTQEKKVMNMKRTNPKDQYHTKHD